MGDGFDAPKRRALDGGTPYVSNVERLAQQLAIVAMMNKGKLVAYRIK